MEMGTIHIKASKSYNLKFRASGNIDSGGEESFSMEQDESAGGPKLGWGILTGAFNHVDSEVIIAKNSPGFAGVKPGQSSEAIFRGKVHCNWPQRDQDAIFTVVCDKDDCTVGTGGWPGTTQASQPVSASGVITTNNFVPYDQVIHNPINAWTEQLTNKRGVLNDLESGYNDEWLHADFVGQADKQISIEGIKFTLSVRVTKTAENTVAILEAMTVTELNGPYGTTGTGSDSDTTVDATPVDHIIWASCDGTFALILKFHEADASNSKFHDTHLPYSGTSAITFYVKSIYLP